MLIFVDWTAVRYNCSLYILHILPGVPPPKKTIPCLISYNVLKRSLRQSLQLYGLIWNPFNFSDFIFGNSSSFF
jgi:hypothetical protein